MDKSFSPELSQFDAAQPRTPGPIPLMVTPLRTIPASDYLDNQSNDAGAGTSTSTGGATKRGRGRPKGSKNLKPSAKKPKFDHRTTDPTVTEEPCNDEAQTPLSPTPLVVTPLRTIRPYDDAGAGPSTVPAKRGRGRPKGSKNSKSSARKPIVRGPNNKLVICYPGFVSGITKEERETGNKEIVDSVLMRFDAVRRRFCQLNHGKGLLDTASSFCTRLGVETNTRKRIGPVPGVEVGDIFYFWGEMCLVGLHKVSAAGIDYLTVKDGAVDGPVATSVVTAGKYNDDTEELNTLIYSGHGGKDKPRDQNMRRGNRALEASHRIGNDVRVIRGKEDPYNKNKKIYIYDGLYLVSDVQTVTGNSGCKEFKFKLVRKPDQPNSGYAIWKLVEDLQKDDMFDPRQGFILPDLSFGRELVRVPLVNEVDEDDKTMPEDFEYITSQCYSSLTLPDQVDRESLGCKNCQGEYSCIQENHNCMCIRKNDDVLPYHRNILVCRKPLIYECGGSCSCPNDCENRLVQNGLKLRMEVFKTVNCGWGLRSWDPIRAGTFICEFAGENKTKEEVEEDDDYLFDTSLVYNKFRWNYEPELASENPLERVPEDINLPTQVLISAKEKGNVGRFMNHSCSPNVFWQPIEYENNGDVYVRIGLFAMKHIPPMTELTYDYGVSSVVETEEGEKVYEGKKTCLCGSVKCRGSFG